MIIFAATKMRKISNHEIIRLYCEKASAAKRKQSTKNEKPNNFGA
jgi:hypothetical protein